MSESLKEVMEGKEATQKQKWAGFVETSAVNFFEQHELEKMAIEDGNGNKAKLSRTKDDGIKVEYSSIVIL